MWLRQHQRIYTVASGHHPALPERAGGFGQWVDTVLPAPFTPIALQDLSSTLEADLARPIPCSVRELRSIGSMHPRLKDKLQVTGLSADGVFANYISMVSRSYIVLNSQPAQRLHSIRVIAPPQPPHPAIPFTPG